MYSLADRQSPRTLWPARPRAALHRTLPIRQSARPLQQCCTGRPGRSVTSLASSRVDDWRDLRVGPQSKDVQSLASFDQLITGFASSVVTPKGIPTATSSTSQEYPDAVRRDPSFLDGCRHFWRGSSTKPATEAVRVRAESDVQVTFFESVLAPTNAAVTGSKRLGWNTTGAAEPVVPLGGRPDFMYCDDDSDDDSDDDELDACGESKSPGVFPGGLQRFVDAAVGLGDPSDPDFKEWLDKRLRPQTDFDSKVAVTLMQISMYAVQHACRSIFLTTGKELVCCTFDVADRPGGGPKKLVVSLSDAVSCSSTDPTMGQAMLYFTKVAKDLPPLPIDEDRYEAKRAKVRTPRPKGGAQPPSQMQVTTSDAPLGKCLGSGAAGSVFAAEWDGAPVAIKVPTESHHCSLDDARQLLQHEEAAYRYLGEHLEGCPGGRPVPELLGSGTLSTGLVKVPALFLGLAAGESLEAAPRSWEVRREVLAAVGRLHGAGVVHGDLRCDNILVDASDPGAPKVSLVDLGRATPGASPQECEDEMQNLQGGLEHMGLGAHLDPSTACSGSDDRRDNLGDIAKFRPAF